MVQHKRDTDRDWKRVAEDDPFWGVLSQEEYRSAAMDAEKLQSFMASGERFVSDLFAFVQKYFVSDFAPQRVLDVGCGVGRLLIPMAKRAKTAVGVDIAPAMLELTAKHAKLSGLKNIELVESDDVMSRVSGRFDLVNTYIVLQHIPPDRGYRIILEMCKRLNVGGIGSIQLTYAKDRQFLLHEQPKARFYRRDGSTMVDLVDSGWSPPEGTINMFDYDLNQVMALLSGVVGHPVICLPTNDDGHLGTHFIFQKARGD